MKPTWCWRWSLIALGAALGGDDGWLPCEFVTDLETKEVPGLPRPAYLAPVMDPVFGTRVLRVTDPLGAVPNVGGSWERVARHHYALDQAWNADQSLLMLDRGTFTRGRLVLDGESYEPLFYRKGPSSADRWHPKKPDLRIFVRANEVGIWNVRTGAVEDSRTFEGYSEFQFGPFEGNPSRDGSRLVVYGTAPDGGKVAFAYDLAKHEKFPDLDLHEVPIDWVGISPLGRYIVINDKEDRTRVLDVWGNQVGPFWLEYGRPSHFDLAIDEDGDEVAVGVSKSEPDEGRVIKRRLRDGRVTVLTPAGFASHTSARNTEQTGWVYVSYENNPDWPPYSCEVVAVKLDGSLTVRRLFHTHRADGGYLSEAHPSPSPDGRRIIWASNWDEPEGPIAAYVTELCDETPPLFRWLKYSGGLWERWLPW